MVHRNDRGLGDGEQCHGRDTAAWFGLEDNNQNSVLHFTANGNGTLADGTMVGIHQEGQFTFNANGVPVVTRVTSTCR